MMSSAVAAPAVGVADGEGHLGAGAGERPGGLDADAGRAAGDDRALAGQVDAGDDLGGGGLGAERCGDASVMICPICVAVSCAGERTIKRRNLRYAVRL